MNRAHLLFLVTLIPLLLFSKISVSEQNLASNQTTSTKFTPVDIMVLLDNSGSMKKNDPRFLVKSAIKQFINGLHSDSRIGIIIFDQSARLATQLTAISDKSQMPSFSTLEKIDYRGLLTNSPQALRLALDELKRKGRPDTEKLIIFLTDGIIDTGNRDRDIKSALTLKNELSMEAAQLGVKIFGITLGTQADFSLMQILAEKTDGQLYRSDRAENLAFLFGQLSKTLEKPESDAVTASIDKKITPIEDEIKADSPPIADQKETISTTQAKLGSKQQQKPITGTTPIQQPTIASDTEMLEDSKNKNIFGFDYLTWILLFGILVCAAILVYLFIHRRQSNDTQHSVAAGIERNDGLNIPKASLIDNSGKLSKKQYDITNNVTVIGRSTDTSNPIGSLLFNMETLSRRHAIIEYKNYHFWIMDLRSSNGTFLNNKRIDTEVCLKHGDKIRFHTLELEFNMDALSKSDATVVVASTPRAEKAHQAEVIRFRSDKELVDNIDPAEPEQQELDLDKETLVKLAEVKGNEDRIFIPGKRSQIPTAKPDSVIRTDEVPDSENKTVVHPGEPEKPAVDQASTLMPIDQQAENGDLSNTPTLLLDTKQQQDRNNHKTASADAIESKGLESDTTIQPGGKDKRGAKKDEQKNPKSSSQ